MVKVGGWRKALAFRTNQWLLKLRLHAKAIRILLGTLSVLLLTWLIIRTNLRCSNPHPDWYEGKRSPPEHYCCPHFNANYELEKSGRGLGKPVSGKGVIVILGQNKPHKTYGRDSLAGLKKTVDLLYKNYNARERDDVLILHEGDFDEESQRQFTAGRPELSFMHLKDENWEVYPESIRNDDRSTWNGNWHDGYRKMIRWYAVRIWPALKEKGYKWVCRFDDDSYLLSEIPYNLFGFMEHFSLQYAYRIVIRESDWSDDKFWPFLRTYAKDRLGGKSGWMMDYCHNKNGIDDFTKANCGHFWMFYNNFFVADIDRFLQEDIQHFLRYVDDSGKMFTLRWNDLIVQSAAVQLFMDKSKVFHMTGWSYGHSSGKPDDLTQIGIVQMGRNINNQRAELNRTVTEVVGWPMHRHWDEVANIHGHLMTLAHPQVGNCCGIETFLC
mmetsp:Transcript_4933/g.9395  ORF Transcript_4933/g.9395 Transcript_4933/m.9395 type:complete len:440 (-) Transcript_4933:184-1503(-)